jgi:hypothetical protein
MQSFYLLVERDAPGGLRVLYLAVDFFASEFRVKWERNSEGTTEATLQTALQTGRYNRDNKS